jgi:TRAP-type mannitol/chloroaromatic compound transport system permease small subunit
MGFNYILNSHPRVDTFTAATSLRGRAVVELLGCLIFAIPYTYVLLYYGVEFVHFSYRIGEASNAVTGLSHRWVIKGIFYLGLVLLMTAILCMTIRCVLYLFGPAALRERAAPKLSGTVLSV